MDIGSIFPVIIDTGIHQDAFEPSLEGNGDFHMPFFIELMNVSEKFGKAFIYDFLNLLVIMLVAVTDFHGIAFQELVKFLLAAPVILPATIYQCANVLITVCQWSIRSFT
jgi:hypothetical protein